jgi:CheY-like chemotaxis protein
VNTNAICPGTEVAPQRWTAPCNAASAGGEQAPATRRRILLVEDDELLRRGMRLILESAGYEVATAPNGVVALLLWMKQPFDLVITDLLMPEKEGVETIVELRQRRPTQKIIAMSGGGFIMAEDYLRIAQALGVTRTLAKPFTPQTFLATVAEALDPDLVHA